MIANARLILLTCITLFLYSNAFAQLASCSNVELGPDTIICSSTCITLETEITEVGTTNSYSVSSINYTPPYAFNEGSPIIVGLDDIWSEIITLPFNFCFFGNTYSKLVVGANGVITFDSTLASPPGFNFGNSSECEWPFSQSIPNSTGIPYRNSINGAFHDIDPSVGGEIRYAIFGTYPCRTFVVNYENIPHFSCNSITTTQQIVLYETTNIIEVYIQDKPTCISWNNGNAVLGIQNETGTLGYTPTERNTGPWATNFEAWAFSPNGSATYSIEWIDNSGNIIGNNDTLVVCPSSTTTYAANVTYDICDGSQVVVTDDINITINNSSCSYPIISNAFISQPIICYGGFATDEMQIEITQTTPITTYACIVGSYIGSYFVSYISTNQTSVATLNMNAFLPNVDYFVRIVDSTAYYNGNGGFPSGISSVGIYDEFGLINFYEPAQIVASTLLVDSNLCVEECIAIEQVTINGGTNPYSINVNGGTNQNLSIGDSVYSFINLCEGIYNINIIDTNNCYGSEIFTINESSEIFSNSTLVSCNPVTWNGTAYATSGVYTFVTQTANGCDSTATLNLTINPSITSSTDVADCDVYTWNGTAYTTSGFYTFSTVNANGCDSTATINLTISPSVTSATTITSCVPITWNGTAYATSGFYNFATLNANGCDSTATLNLIISPSVTSTTPINSCVPVTWNGQTYTSSGVYIFATVNANGCDSTATLNLTINPSTTSTSTLTECDTYSWNGQTYASGGVYNFATVNANGCDSTATLNLTINTSTLSSTDVIDCDAYTWNGTAYATSGIYNFTTVNANGCDSTAKLSLTINPASAIANIAVDACNSYYWNGTNYENSGVYSFTTTNKLGCDSTTILTLNVFEEEFFVPNTFTPNKIDNINDRFFVYNNLVEFKMWIYNRWGEKIFYAEDGQLGWDGKYKNKICQDGLYAWKIAFFCGLKLQIETGHILLLK